MVEILSQEDKVIIILNIDIIEIIDDIVVFMQVEVLIDI